MGTVVLSRVQSGRGLKLTVYLQQEARLRRSGNVQFFLSKCLHGVARHKFIFYIHISLVLYTVYVGMTARLRHKTAISPLHVYFIKRLTAKALIRHSEQ